jgi:SAM-dependent methyltransferase
MSVALAPRRSVVRRIRSRLYPRAAHPFEVYRQETFRLASRAERIIDVGCGHTAPDLEAIPAHRCKVGVDPDADLRPAAAPSVKFVRATSTRLPFPDASFDLLLSKSVLEHLESPEESFREFARVLRPGGTALLLTPNRWDYVSMISTLVPNRLHPWIVRVTTGRDESDTFPTYYRANTAGRLRSLAARCGLQVTSVRHLREHPHYLAFSTPSYVAGVLFEQAVQRPCGTLRPWLLAMLRKQSR